MLTTITIITLVVSFIAAIASQIWKGSIEIQGHVTKRLTPAGWLSLGVALVGLSASIAAELIRINIRSSEELQKKQEASWRRDVSDLLKAAKVDIERNLEKTINGFQEGQRLSNRTQTEVIASRQSLLESSLRQTREILIAGQRTQTEVIASRQSLLESSLRQTREILIAGQPLTSLILRFQFDNDSQALSQLMREGQDRLYPKHPDPYTGPMSEGQERLYIESLREPDPPPSITEFYDDQLLPLISYIVRVGRRFDASEAKGENIIVLLSLDESHNAILSFGRIDDALLPSNPKLPISAGFPHARGQAREGYSYPQVHWVRDRGAASYSIDWSLAPVTLRNALDRSNDEIFPSAKLPKVLKILILYNFDEPLVDTSNFALARQVWNTPGEEIAFGNELSNAMLMVTVNSLPKTKYTLRRLSSIVFTKEVYVENDERDMTRTIENPAVRLDFEASNEAF